MSSLPQSELAGILFQEIEGYLPEIEHGIAELQSTSANQEILSEVHRLFHNIKGAASQVSFAGLSQSAAFCEAVLADLLEENNPATPSHLEFLGGVNEHIKEFCYLEEKSSEAEENLLAETVSSFQQLMTTLSELEPVTHPESNNTAWSGDENLEIAEPAATCTTGGDELDALRGECLSMLRSIVPLLQELTGHSSRKSAGLLPLDILRKIISALSTLAYCTGTAGFSAQEKLIRNFLGILYSYQRNLDVADTSTVGLIQEFLAYLDLIYSLPPENGMQVLAVVQGQLDRVLDSLFPRTGKSKTLQGDLDRTEPITLHAPDDELAPEADAFAPLGPVDNEDFGDTSFSDDEEAELLSIFLAECMEHLESIAKELEGLPAIEAETSIPLDDQQRVILNTMRVRVHTLKGAAAMTGFSHIAAFAYALEKLFRWLHEESRDLGHDDLLVIADGVTRLQFLADLLHGENWETEEADSEFVHRHLQQRMQRQAEIEKLEQPHAASPAPEQDGNTSLEHLPVDAPPYDSGQVNEQLDSGFLSALQEIDQFDIIDNLANNTVQDSNPETDRSEALSEDERELLDIFRTECSEHLLSINHELNNLAAQVRTECLLSAGLRDELARLRRGVHTLKGAAAMTGFDQLAGCAHTLEDLLDWLHDDAGTISPEDISLIAEAVDLIETHARSPWKVQDEDGEGLARRIEEHLQVRTALNANTPQSQEELPESEQTPHAVHDGPTDEQTVLAAESGNIRVKLQDLEELVNIEGELVVTRGSVEKLLDRFSRSLQELSTIKDSLRRKAQELEVGFEAQSLYGFGPGAPFSADAAEATGGGITSEFDPIELDRYSQLNLIIRSLNEISIDISAVHSEMLSMNSSMQGLVARQQLSMELMQEKLLRIRMTPFSAISSTLYRTVRQTAGRLGKDVELQVSGEDVMMDRFIWSKTMDPLMHMLRNCIDHGIEDQQTRSALKKSPTGRIIIDAVQRGRMVSLRISDDGRGVDTARLRRKLVAENLIAADSSLSDEELLPYLFRPSVSTRDDISEISGRGVGLDIVFRNIQELRGKVKIINTPGHGVTFELNIPVTLSVNRAIIIALGDRRFAVPIQDIVEVRRFHEEERIAGEQPQVLWNNQAIPLHRLGPYLNLPATGPTNDSTNFLTFVVDNGEKHLAFQIDRIEEQREVIVKDLGSHLRYVKGISGVTVTGEGAIIPVLNLNELTAGGNAILAETTASAVRDVSQRDPLRVLIVDDSISVRYSLSRLIESRSWQPLQAVDGVDALEKLAPFAPDVIILDIEMPRMNGYEFMAILRSSKEHGGLPVIMLTSRASEKHRRKAEELGVNHYLTKPFQEDEFLGLLNSVEAQRLN